MRPKRRNLVGAALVGVVAAALCSVPFAFAAFVSSTASQSATYSSGSVGTPGGTSVVRGTCVAHTSFQLVVSWSAASNATSYDVLRSSTSGGPYTQVGSTSGTSLTDSGPQVGPPAFTWQTTYYYVVRAVRGNWQSGNSVEASALTPKAANCT